MTVVTNITSEYTTVVSQLQGIIDVNESKREELRAELDKVDLELRRARKALDFLTGEPPRKPGRKPANESARPEGKVRSTGISPDRLDDIRRAVLQYGEHHEEFRQVDIRATVSGRLANSGLMAKAFELLRQEGTIRFARVDGNHKYFRLSRQATQTMSELNGTA
jgi:hypothetical protein